MRLARGRLIVLSLLLAVPSWAQQAVQGAPQPVRDPEGLAVVEAAITAMGGATAIGRVQSWTFLGQMEGRIEDGGHIEILTWPFAAGSAPGARADSDGALPWHSPRSIYAPALLSAILLNQLQNATYGIGYLGTSNVGPQSLIGVSFSVPTKAGASLLAQTWYFNSSNDLPVTVAFRVPLRIGDTEAFPCIISLSDYRSVAGLLYPFRIVEDLQRRSIVQVISIQSVIPNALVAGAQ